MNVITGLPRNRDDKPDRKFIEALARGLDILRAFEPGDGFLGNQEIASRTTLPKSSVSRLTYTLTKLGYLTYSERLEKYQLGSGVLALGYAFVSNLAIRQVAKPLMNELANVTSASIGLTDRDRLHMIYVEHSAPKDVTTFRGDVGVRLPIEVSATGRAYLAALKEEEREHLLMHIEKKMGKNFAKIKVAIDEAVKCYQQYGYCYSWRDWNPDTNAIAVPLRLNQGQTYVFNAGGPSFRLDEEVMVREVLPQLKNIVRNIEATLIRY